MAKKGKTSSSKKSSSVSKVNSKSSLVKKKVSANKVSKKTSAKLKSSSKKSRNTVHAESQSDVSLQSSSFESLPELPNFDGLYIPAPSADSQPVSSEEQVAQQPVVDLAPKEKKSWMSWLLPKKKTASDSAQLVSQDASLSMADVTKDEPLAEIPKLDQDASLDQPVSEELTNELVKDFIDEKPTKETKKSKKNKAIDDKTVPSQVKHEEHIARAYDEIDAMKVKLDSEMRDRQLALDETHEHLKGKEAELEKWHEDLMNREKDIVSKEKEYARIKKLESELEDKEITLKHQEEEIEDLKNKLAEKELELTQKEGELKELATRLENAQTQVSSSQSNQMHVSDDYHKLAKKHGHSTGHKAHPKAVLSKSTSSVSSPTKREIRSLLLRAYDELAAADMSSLQSTYGQIRDSYAQMITVTGPDEQLYKDILDLYNDIKLAAVQRS